MLTEARLRAHGRYSEDIETHVHGVIYVRRRFFNNCWYDRWSSRNTAQAEG